MPYRPIQILRRAVLLLFVFLCRSHQAFALGEPDYIENNAAPGKTKTKGQG